MWDISFCSNKKCKNKECERNQNNYNFMLAGNRPISIMEFKECEYYKAECELYNLCGRKLGE